MTKRFALVCCGKQKLPSPAPAKEMYQSSLFKKTRAFVEANYDGWFIVSARYEAVAPDEIIKPYDHKLSPSAAPDWARRVSHDLAQRIPPGSHIDFFGGATYELVTKQLPKRGYTVGNPLKGLQVGERLRWLNQHGASA